MKFIGDNSLRFESFGRTMRTLGTIVLVCVLLLGSFTQTTAVVEGAAGGESGNTIKKSMTSMFGVKYDLRFNPTTHTISVSATNPTNESQPSGVTVTIDNRTLLSGDLRLAPGENWSTTMSVNSSLDALRTAHVVRVSTFGCTRTFEFDFAVDPETSTVVPTPYISRTEVSRAVVDGEQSTVVNVTVVNPSNQMYPTKLMVHTKGTDGSFYAAIVPPSESETIAVELLDGAESTVVGEARLYVDRFNDSEGGIDQVGFTGRVGGDTSMWNESYEAVEGPWGDDPYQYRNASVGEASIAERASGGHEIRGVPVVVPIAAVAVLALGFLLARRLR